MGAAIGWDELLLLLAPQIHLQNLAIIAILPQILNHHTPSRRSLPVRVALGSWPLLGLLMGELHFLVIIINIIIRRRILQCFRRGKSNGALHIGGGRLFRKHLASP